MPTLTKKTSNGAINEKKPVKQDKSKVERDALGRLLPGSTANPNGRPPAGKTIVDQFRDNPNAQAVINKLFNVANTLDQDKPHKDAISAAKLIVERLVPSLKASEHIVNDQSDQPFILMPEPREPDKE
tara:strand:+ start:146 stop:529 length:384 start_codon:yes stop_codon:yes gene_type:complete